MPFTLSTLISGRPNRFPPQLYFPPGGHTHDRHTIPADRLHISLSDPVLVAAEQRLSDVPNAHRQSKLLIIDDAGARQTAKPGSVVFHPEQDGSLSQRSGDRHLAPKAVNPPATVPNTQGTRQGHCWKTGFQGAVGNTDSSAYDNRYTLTNNSCLPDQ